MAGWKTELTRSFAHAQTAHELGTELVRLRQLLRPRVALAEHPGWPEPIRAALLEGLRSDLCAIQEELEKAAGKTSAASRIDRSRSDELVAAVRRNPLTFLLPLAPSVVPAAESSTDTETKPGRRIIF